MPSNAPSRIVPEDFYELRFAFDPQISPDGKHVAYVVRASALDRKGYRNTIWLSDAAGKVKRFTHGPGRDHSPRWSPDGAALFFVSDRGGSPQLWRIPLDGGEAEPLTHLACGASNPVPAPDGKRLLFTARVNAEEREAQDNDGVDNSLKTPEELERIKEECKKCDAEKSDPRVITRTVWRTGTEFFDDRRAHLFVLDLDTGAVKRLTDGAFDYVNPAWSPDGKYVYCGAKRTGDTDDSLLFDLLRIPARGGRPKRLLQALNWNLTPKPAPDGKHIAFLEVDDYHTSAQLNRLALVDADGKGKRRLLKQFDRDVYAFEWARDGKGLYFTSGDRGAVGLHHVPLRGKGPTRADKRAGTRMVREFTLASGMDRAACVVSTTAFPSDVIAIDLKTKRERRLSGLNADFLKRKRVQPVEELWYESKDGTEVQGWLIKPPGFRKDRKYPLAVEIHGGPHVMWSAAEATMWHEWQLLASAGYVVFFCNPRGSDGYGFQFKDAIHDDWGGPDMADILSGVDRVVKKGFVDEQKLCVTGGSFGGFMSAWIIGQDRRFAAAVAQRGVYEILSFYGTTDVSRLIEWEFDARPWEDPLKLWAASPIAHVEKIQTPLLILHSENDFRVPIAGAEELFVSLRKLGKTVQFVRFPEEGHELSRSGQPKRAVKRLEHILAWFEEHTKRG